jgi:hypothetical protein
MVGLQMVRSGIWMNVVAIVLITLASSTLIPLILAFGVWVIHLQTPAHAPLFGRASGSL